MEKDKLVVYITEGRWPGVLVVVDEMTDWGIKGYMPIPGPGDVVDKAYVRLERGKYQLVGAVTEII